MLGLIIDTILRILLVFAAVGLFAIVVTIIIFIIGDRNDWW